MYARFMKERRHIRAIGDAEAPTIVETGDEAESSQEQPIGEDVPEAWDDDEPVHPGSRRWPMLLAALAILAVLGWSGFFVWANQAEMLAGATPERWIGWVSQWAMPVLLVSVAWLIAMRSSARETARFGDAARLLSHESASLEARLVHVNRELSLAREFLAAQSRELDYVGRSAAERISEHADKLQALVVDNGAQVDAIAGVSATALSNMSELRDNLPVIANSARDVTNQIAGAGRSAKAQLGELVTGFERLNEFGQASERQVTSLRERIDTTLEDLNAFVETMDANNAARFAALRVEDEALLAQSRAREEAALEAIRKRGETLREELVAAHDARQLEEAAALAAMRGRMAVFTQEAHDAAAAVRAGERAAQESWEAQVAALRARLENVLAEVAELDRKALETAREKLDALTAEAERVDASLAERDAEFQARIARRDADFAASAETAYARLTGHDEQFGEIIAKREAAISDATEAAFQRLSDRAAELDGELAKRQETQTALATELGDRAETLAARVGEIEAHMASIVERGDAAEQALGASASHFAEAVGSNSVKLAETEAAIARLTDASVRLLELIQAAAQHSKTELPTAIEGFESKLGSARDSSSEIRSALEDAQLRGEELKTALAEMQGAGASAIGDIDALRSRLAGTAEEQSSALAALREQLGAAHSENRAFAESVATELSTAVEKLKDSTRSLLGDFEAGQSERISALAARIGDESGAAIDRAVEARTEEAVSKLDEATARSGEAAREAVAQMRDQLARVHELTVNLESRAARAREQVEEQVDNDFARRMALITESLNSHSIDIAKALSTEVTDTAWASYLKGDRGVFTRRAVKLIDGGEAREISGLYESDHEFRAHVSRYIHDFEAMLRTMLSTRDGHALGVTMLSSDMGKLYVALAQSIQRLRQ